MSTLQIVYCKLFASYLQISRDLILHDVRGKPQKALKVFSSIIKGLKEDFASRLEERVSHFGANCVDEEVHWVLTVPAIWDEKAKQFMRVAAQEVRHYKGPSHPTQHLNHILFCSYNNILYIYMYSWKFVIMLITK